ncbi:MAG TPA: SUMF1/EgtB/PvdO family nonheme iron enzyme [Polyangiaceae bacterium]
MRRAIAAAIVLAAAGAAVAVVLVRGAKAPEARCSAGFVARGPRCFPAIDGCPPPLVVTARGCDAPDVRVLIPAASIAIGPSDWESEGRVAARSVHVRAFRIDAFEVTRGRWFHDVWQRDPTDDEPRAISAVTRADAEAFCVSQGGRLPTEDEWMVAAASTMNPPRRYPWGDTGAVCRRAAWGLETGPCAHGARGPDTVGAHTDGDSPLGLHDLAGNVAEWVAAEPAASVGVAKGGSWQSTLAGELRIWARLEVDPDAHDPRVGVRCAYPP